jgi:hypothetical protein
MRGRANHSIRRQSQARACLYESLARAIPGARGHQGSR